MASAGTINVTLRADLRNFEGALRRAETNLDRTGRRLREIGERVTLGLSAPIAGLGFLALRSSIQFEQAMAGVAKTVDAPEAAIRALGEEFTRMSETVPVARNELARIGEQAGQLGVQLSRIPGFTRTIAALRVSTDLGDEAATSIARLANVTGTADTEFDRLGSTIVALGNNLETAEAELLHTAQFFASTGNAAGLAASDILGIAAAIRASGIRAEAGGSAVQAILLKIREAAQTGGEELRVFARVAGRSAREFAERFEEDAAGAFLDFIAGIQRLEREGQNTAAVLDALGLAERRTTRTVLGLAAADDTLARSLRIANDGFRDNVALTNEANRFYNTTAGRLKVLRNRVSNLAGDLGDALVPSLLRLVEAADPVLRLASDAIRMFTSLPTGVQATAIAITGLLGVLGPAAFIVGNAASAVGGLIGGLGSLARTLSVGGLVFSIRSMADATTLARMSLSSLAGLVTPGGVLLAGLGILATAFFSARMEAAEAARAFASANRQLRATTAGLSMDEALRSLSKTHDTIAAIEDDLAGVRAEQERLAPGGVTAGLTTGGRRELKQLQDREAFLERILRLQQASQRALERQVRARAAMAEPAGGDTGGGGLDLGLADPSVQEQLQKALARADALRSALGEGFDVASAKASAYRTALEGLIEKGVEPGSAEVQRYAERLQHWQAVADQALLRQQAMNRAVSFARTLLADTRTPLQAYNEGVRLLVLALQAGAINAEQFRVAVRQLNGSLAEGAEEGSSFGGVIENFAQGFVSSIAQAVASGEASFERFFDSVKRGLIELALKFAIFKAISAATGGTGGIFGGSLFGFAFSSADGRAHGGPVRRGTPYVVGERGPELFVPKRSGTIVPNGDAGAVRAQPVSVTLRVDPIDIFRMAVNPEWQTLHRETTARAAEQGAG